jgi:hypothetical protein
MWAAHLQLLVGLPPLHGRALLLQDHCGVALLLQLLARRVHLPLRLLVHLGLPHKRLPRNLLLQALQLPACKSPQNTMPHHL